MRSWAVSSLHCAIVLPWMISVSIDPLAIVGPQPMVWYFAAADSLVFDFQIENHERAATR